jgi:hypothetical protein
MFRQLFSVVFYNQYNLYIENKKFEDNYNNENRVHPELAYFRDIQELILGNLK